MLCISKFGLAFDPLGATLFHMLYLRPNIKTQGQVDHKTADDIPIRNEIRLALMVSSLFSMDY